MPEVQLHSDSSGVDHESLGRHGTQIGIAAPLVADELAIEVATRVLVAELRRRLQTLTLQLYVPDAGAVWRRWPNTVPVEMLTVQTPSSVDALVVLDGVDNAGSDGSVFDDVLSCIIANGESDVLIRLPLVSANKDVDVDIDALLELAPRIIPELDQDKVLAGLRSRGMWTEADAVIVDIRGHERPPWWWPAVEARVTALGANVLTSNFDASRGGGAASYPHLDGGVGPETMMIAIANAAAVVTDDRGVALLARALGTPCASAQGAGSDELNRALVDGWRHHVEVSPERLLAVDLAIDKVAEVAGATASLRSPVSFNLATARLTRRVVALETAHERIVARMVAERRVAGEKLAELTEQVREREVALHRVREMHSELVRVFGITQIELRNLQLRENREVAGQRRLRRWSRWVLRGLRRLVPRPVKAGVRWVLRGLRRLVPRPVKAGVRRVVRRLRRLVR